MSVNQDDHLLSLLERYHTLCRQGHAVNVEALCGGDAALVERLRHYLDVEARLQQAAKTPTGDTPNPADLGETLSKPTPPAQPNTVPSAERYEVLQKLGEGGMGTVYRAHDRDLKRDVALKVIRPDSMTAQLRQRFRTEAQAVAALDHPGIVKVYDFGEWSHGGTGPAPFLALEYVSGGNLSRHLSDKPMDVMEAVKLVRLLAKAVAHAHARGVVHRDLKPDNVLIACMADEPALNCALGCPKITDFGLAKRLEGQRLTHSGAVMGTPHYMAPEQAEGLEAGPPADVWALGVILYRLLSGKVPFNAKSVIDVLHKVCHDQPVPPRQARPEIPEELEALCLECMSKDPTKRPTATVLATRLGGLPSVPTLIERPVDPPRPAEDARVSQVGQRTLQIGCIIVVTFGILVSVAIGAVAVLVWALYPAKPTNTPNIIREKPTPLTGSMEVRAWTLDSVNSLKVGVDDGVVPVRRGYRFQIEVKLNEPAYAYLMWIDGKGEVTPLYPWNEDTVIRVQQIAVDPPVLKARHINSPSLLSKGWRVDATEGLDTVLLLARREPWPAGRNLAELLGKVPAAPLRNEGEVVVRGWDRGQRVEVEQPSDLHRGLEKEAVAIDDDLLQLVDRIAGEFEVIRAVRFAHAK